jgi:translation initiation factor 2 beta subunit (eIF-2beta)/eIF-5
MIPSPSILFVAARRAETKSSMIAFNEKSKAEIEKEMSEFNKEHIHCPVCGAKQEELSYLEDELDRKQCWSCGLWHTPMARN